MKLNLNIINSKMFYFVKDENMFIGEMSDFQNQNLFNQLYDDACDCGMVIKSNKTGKEVTFYLSETVYDSENCITHWTFLPVVDKNTPEGAKNTKVVVFND